MTALTGDSPAAAGDDPRESADTGRGRRVLSLSIEAPAREPGQPRDLSMTFRGGFEFRLRLAPADGGQTERATDATPPVDHVTVCVDPENLDGYADRLCASLPSASCERYGVGTEDSGMRIAAIADPVSGAHIVLAAPTGRSGQVADFLANTGCEGLQHVAFTVPSVRAALGQLGSRGMRFIGASAERAEEAVIELREEDRWLRQAFTEPLWGEFFIEVLERNGITGLHPSNIQSLYDINERGRARVGDISDAPDLRASG